MEDWCVIEIVLIYCVSEHCSCHVMFWWMQAFYAIIHPCSGTRCNVKLNDSTHLYSCVIIFLVSRDVFVDHVKVFLV
jgi:hypothetical protein